MFGPAIGELMAALAAQNLAPAGPVFAHHLKMPPDIFDFELGVPVGAPIAATRGVRPRQRPAMKVARTSSNRRTTTATLRGEGLGREIDYYVYTILRSILRDDNGGLIIALHLRLSLDDARKPAANLPDAKNTRRTGGKGSRTAVDLLLERSQAGLNSLHQRDRNRDAARSKLTLDFGACVLQSRSGREPGTGRSRKALREEHVSPLEIGLGSPSPIGVRYFEKVHFRQSAVEFGRRFLLGKLDNRDIEAPGNKGGNGGIGG